MSRYILMPAAQEDLAGIRDYYLEEAGYRVGRQMIGEFVEEFRFLARTHTGGGTYPARLGWRPAHPLLADVGLSHPLQARNEAAGNPLDLSRQPRCACTDWASKAVASAATAAEHELKILESM